LLESLSKRCCELKKVLWHDNDTKIEEPSRLFAHPWSNQNVHNGTYGKTCLFNSARKELDINKDRTQILLCYLRKDFLMKLHKGA
jgi:hypothetical protein